MGQMNMNLKKFHGTNENELAQPWPFLSHSAWHAPKATGCGRWPPSTRRSAPSGLPYPSGTPLWWPSWRRSWVTFWRRQFTSINFQVQPHGDIQNFFLTFFNQSLLAALAVSLFCLCAMFICDQQQYTARTREQKFDIVIRMLSIII